MKKRILTAFGILGLYFLLPATASAHGGEPTLTIAPALSWGFLGFGVLVILGVALVLFSGGLSTSTARTNRAVDFQRLTGFSGYVGKMRLFSRNARLYMVHVVGMDVIYGTWAVIFNLYLLAIGFDIAFVGLRILLAAVTRAIVSVPAGLISDRIGRKLSFVLGDGGGAVMSLLAISTGNPTLILATGAIGGAFGALHGVAEPAFMAENSEDFERVHLFSVASGTRTAAAIIGSALAGLVPLMLMGREGVDIVGLYRLVAYVGIGGWFASLIPAVMLQQVGDSESAKQTDGLRSIFAGVRHPRRIARLIAPEVLVALGAGFVLPLLNVFFDEGLGGAEVEIGAAFAAGQGFLVVGAFLAPLVAARLGKVNSVVVTRLLAIPFILLIAFSPNVGGTLGSVLTVAGLAHIARITFANMAGPVRSAFAMEILDPGERGTQVGIEMALASAVSGGASFLGAQLMNRGDYSSPFVLMAVFTLAGSILFWHFFADYERSTAAELEPAEVAVPGD